MVPTADRQKATVLVRIGFKQLDPRILPDMGVKVTFLRADGEAAAPQGKPAILVPKGAVREENDRSVVFIVRGNRVERRAVKVSGPDGDRVEVVAGLEPGDPVVVAPPPGLRDGAVVMVK